jgi:peptidyl serine alpha-galactosyltransferase
MQRRKTGEEALEGGSSAVTSTFERPPIARSSSKLKKEKSPTIVWLAMGTLLVVFALALYVMQQQHRSNPHGFVDPPSSTVSRRTTSHVPAAPQKQGSSDNAGAAVAATSKLSGGYEYHIVFSTGCSIYQDWQSYVFFHRAMVVNQPGTITRIVSGCDDKESEEKITQIFNEQIKPMAPDRFTIHITPDYSKLDNGKHFVYFNKPFGMKHWLENKLGFPNKPSNKDAIVILVDPDQLILRPFRNNDFSNTAWAHIAKGATPYSQVEHGRPMGQLYGFGLQWRNKVNMTAIAPHSPVDQLSYTQAQAGYIVGPPYVATAQDMYTIVSTWCNFAKPVHTQYPYLLAEMFAYCLGAAHEQLPHQTARSFMISDVFTGNMEGWNYIDKMPDQDVCGTFREEEVPNVLHFCQRYGLGNYFFGKRKLPKDFLSCESPLLREPPTDLYPKYNWAMFPPGKPANKKIWTKEMAKRNAFVLCVMIPALNEAATYYKKNHCDASANFKKELVFIDGFTEDE